MNLNDAQQLAVEKMTLHGLFEKGWSFGFDNAKKRFGVCRYRLKKIQLSVELTTLNDREDVLDVILHEIAHALAGSKAGHGKLWKEKCIEIGAKPKRCYGNHVTIPQSKYIGTCSNGHIHHATRSSVLTNRRSCNICSNENKFNPEYIITYRLNENYVPTQPKQLQKNSLVN